MKVYPTLEQTSEAFSEVLKKESNKAGRFLLRDEIPHFDDLARLAILQDTKQTITLQCTLEDLNQIALELRGQHFDVTFEFLGAKPQGILARDDNHKYFDFRLSRTEYYRNTNSLVFLLSHAAVSDVVLKEV